MFKDEPIHVDLVDGKIEWEKMKLFGPEAGPTV
jgi:hypothetical protein